MLRIFLSSTSLDLAEHRKQVREAILRLENLPISMETFGARPGVPVAECQALAASADAVVVLVGHRYGFVPPPESGGDGTRSITWLEVDAARSEGRPVLAFLVDQEAPWPHVREQDRLLSEPARAQEIAVAVQGLLAFRKHLSANCIHDTFRSADDLAAKVTAALARLTRVSASRRPASRVWRRLVVHALQPARHFAGRSALLADLVDWVCAPLPSERVVSLVAVGGTGKTALAQKVLDGMPRNAAAGIFVWSFYDDARTEEFLRVACEYFTGGPEVPVSARLEHLQGALAGDTPHLLVLDGLERVQTEGRDGRLRGTLEDPQLRRLLRWLASGVGGARALVTSRFPLADLESWEGSGHRAHVLEDLEAEAARTVLRGWGVRGEDSRLDALHSALHGHALSVAVLGSYLGHFCGGRPEMAPSFTGLEAETQDPKAARLARILDEYARVLNAAELDLLTRLAVFPRPVRVSVLVYLAEAGGAVAGTLQAYGQQRITVLLERLHHLGLVFAHMAGTEAVYSAHPFLREYFAAWADLPVTDIHEAVRTRLAPGLETRPRMSLAEPALLDRYEELIEHTRLAGRMVEAFELYLDVLGRPRDLLYKLGDNARVIRILSGFARDGMPENVSRDLSDIHRWELLRAWSFAVKNLGDLDMAARALRAGLAISRDRGSTMLIVDLLNSANLHLLAAQFAPARDRASEALSLATAARAPGETAAAHGFYAVALARLGDATGAERHFKLAKRSHERRNAYVALFEADFRFLRGDIAGARACVDTGLLASLAEPAEPAEREMVLCELFLGELALPDTLHKARTHLLVAREFAAASGDIPIILRGHALAARTSLHEGDLAAAFSEAEAGRRVAEGCGFVREGMDLRLLLASIRIEAGEAGEALELAGAVHARAATSDCGCLWTQSDALHLMGRAQMMMREMQDARQRLARAVSLRTYLCHPRLKESRALLDLVST